LQPRPQSSPWLCGIGITADHRFISIHNNSHDETMNSLKVARVALRAARPSVPKLARRGYADVAPDKIRLSLALPHQVRVGR
jgi:hypothetical protein